MLSRDRCPNCNVLLDKPWMVRAHRCVPKGVSFFKRKLDKKFVKQLIVTEVILVSYVMFLLVV